MQAVDGGDVGAGFPGTGGAFMTRSMAPRM